MVKSAAQRTAKYVAKNDSEAIRIRFANLKVSMEANGASKQAEIADLQGQTRDILDAYGIAAIFTVPYQAACMKCYGKANRFGGLTLTNEITRVLNDYQVQGLNTEVLVSIGQIFNVTWTPV